MSNFKLSKIPSQNHQLLGLFITKRGMQGGPPTSYELPTPLINGLISLIHRVAGSYFTAMELLDPYNSPWGQDARPNRTHLDFAPNAVDLPQVSQATTSISRTRGEKKRAVLASR